MLQTVYMIRKEHGLAYARYAIIYGMADPLVFPQLCKKQQICP